MSITARLLNIFDFDTGMGEVTWVVRKDKKNTTYQIRETNASETLCPAVRNPRTKRKFKKSMSLSLLLCFPPPVIYCKPLPDAMVHRKIGNDMTERALYLLMEAGWEMESTAEALGVSTRLMSSDGKRTTLHIAPQILLNLSWDVLNF